jgi:hypothetical protein
MIWARRSPAAVRPAACCSSPSNSR